MPSKARPKRIPARRRFLSAGPGAGSRRDWRIAGALVLLLCGVYLLDGTFLIGNDVKGTLNLPENLLKFGSFGFAPSKSPYMFTWIYRAPDGRVGGGEIRSSDTRIDGIPVAELYKSGRLKVAGEGYYLTPSVRKDRQTGERLFVNTFGPGAALAALPFFAILSACVGDLSTQPWHLWYGGKFVASLLVACSAALVFLTARRLAPLGSALLIALALALGTSVWSVSSQTLWQHAPNEFFLTLGTFFLVRWKPGDANSAACGFCYACAVACRPDSIAFVVSAAVYFLIVDRGAFLRYALAALPIALLLGTYNAYYLGSPFTFGQSQTGAYIARLKTGSARVWQTPLYVGLPGVLFSPARGLFVYSPFLLFALAGAVACWRDKRWQAMRVLTVAAPIMILIESAHYDWWGGWSWSYRKIVDVTPALALLLAPILGAVLARRWLLGVFLMLLAWSIAIQILGAWAFDVAGWNNKVVAIELLPAGQNKPMVMTDIPAARAEIGSGSARLVREITLDVDQPANRWRLWSWSDNPIGFYAAHFASSRETRIENARQWTTPAEQ